MASAGDIGFALRTSLWGWIAAPIGVLLLVVSAIHLSRRDVSSAADDQDNPRV